jgi:hypothetical protein
MTKTHMPCQKCPWTSKDQRDKDSITSDIRQAAVDGLWFCCHVNMGTCYGAQRYGEAVRKKEGLGRKVT